MLETEEDPSDWQLQLQLTLEKNQLWEKTKPKKK